MTTPERFGLVLAGIAIGAAATASVSAAQARFGAPPTRLLVTRATTNVPATREMFFIRDAATGACWIAAQGQPGFGITALATAPSEACR